MNSRDACLILVVMVVASTFCLFVTVIPDTTSATTLFVGGTGPANFTTIQSAVDFASPGDIVYVYSGAYGENVVLNKIVTLVGEARNNTTIDSSGTGNVLEITSDWVNVSGFTITGSGPDWYEAGIFLSTVENCTISDINFTLNDKAGLISYLAKNNLIENSVFYSNGYNAIRLEYSFDYAILNSTFLSHQNYAIYIQDSRRNEVRNNTIYDNDYGGVRLGESHQNVIVDNNLTGNVCGLYVDSSDHNIINNNTVNSTRYSSEGIGITRSFNNTLSNNIISSHDSLGIYLHDSQYLTLRDNKMIDDGIHIEGLYPENWNTHIIDTSNTVNGKSVRYWKNITGGTVPLDTGQVLLANCTNVTVHDLSLNNGTTSILVGYSSGAVIESNTVLSNDLFGLYAYLSNNTTITDNTFSYNSDDGIWLERVLNNTITNNTIVGNGANGMYLGRTLRSYVGNNTMANPIRLLWSQDNVVFNNTAMDDTSEINLHISYNNTVSWNQMLIHLTSSDLNTVDNNTASNGYNGLRIENSDHNVLMDNTASSNLYHGIYLVQSTDNDVMNNTAFQNNKAGIYLQLSSNNTLGSNNISLNEDGIVLDESDENTISDNTLQDNSRDGITLGYSRYASITRNDMSGNGIFILSSPLENWNTHDITTSNTVDGRPVQYWKNQTGGTVTSGAGQVILANCTNVSVENQNLSYGTAGIEVGFSSFNTLANNTALFNNRYGISLYISHNNTMVNNNASHSGYRGILVDNSNRTIIDNNSATFNNFYALYHIYSDNSRIVNNTFVRNNGVGMSILYSNHTLIAHNDASSNNLRGISISRSNNNTVDNNIILDHMDLMSYGISLFRSFDNVITGNSASFNFTDGIHISESESNYVANNTAHWNHWSGIRAWQTGENTIVGNTAFWNGWYGVYLFIADNITVSDNNLLYNGWAGIELNYASDNIITDNNASHSNWYGIWVEYSVGNMLVNNTVYDNDRGFNVQSSTGNTFYHNKIIDNIESAFDDGSNIWDNGYPSGGNYWNDYTGADLLSGPSQDQLGSDGIGDTPYDITGNSNRDRYPLMGPTSPVPPYPPSISRNLQATAGIREINLTWEAPIFDGRTPVTNYRIYRGTMSGGESFLVEIGNATNYTDTVLVEGQPYYYKVSAVNAIGEGPLSNEATAAPLPQSLPPIDPMAVLSGTNLQNVTITWGLSPDDGSGFQTVIGYRILQGTVFDPDGVGYVVIASMSNGTSQFTDPYKGEGDPNDYFYQICSESINGDVICSSVQVAKLSLQLSAGVRLLSLPLIQVDESVGKVLQTTSLGEAWSYLALSQEWKSFVKSKPYASTLSTINLTMGVWVDIIQDSDFTIAGRVPTQTTIVLHTGWNLVGFPSFNTTYTVDDLKMETGATRVEGFDSTAPPYYLRVLQDSDVLMAGYGYWIYLDTDTTWTVSND